MEFSSLCIGPLTGSCLFLIVQGPGQPVVPGQWIFRSLIVAISRGQALERLAILGFYPVSSVTSLGA